MLLNIVKAVFYANRYKLCEQFQAAGSLDSWMHELGALVVRPFAFPEPSEVLARADWIWWRIRVKALRVRVYR